MTGGDTGTQPRTPSGRPRGAGPGQASHQCFRQGCRSVEEFQCLNRIEEGTYGVVYRAKDKKTGAQGLGGAESSTQEALSSGGPLLSQAQHQLPKGGWVPGWLSGLRPEPGCPGSSASRSSSTVPYGPGSCPVLVLGHGLASPGQYQVMTHSDTCQSSLLMRVLRGCDGR